MRIRFGYELIYGCPQATPMILTLNVHFSRVQDLIVADQIVTSPEVPIASYRDSFGNCCTRIVAPQGDIRISTDALINDAGLPDDAAPSAPQVAVEDLPQDTLLFLLGSRYCETDRLSDTAWSLFGQTSPGWPRVQAICDFVHDHITFWLSLRLLDPNGLRGFQRTNGRVPRFCSPGSGLLPLHEHSRALLHRLPGRHRSACRARAHGFRRMVRGLLRRPLVYLRCTPQCAANRPCVDRERAGRGGRSIDEQLWSALAPGFSMSGPKK